MSLTRDQPPSSFFSPGVAAVFAWILLAVVVSVVYARAFDIPFIFDDETAIVANRSIRVLWPLNEPLRPPRDSPVAGRPLVNWSLALNYAISGLSPRSYHVFNVALHALSAGLLFSIVRRTLVLSKFGGPVYALA